MAWKDPGELYNDGKPFKICARDERGVIVSIIADNYFGYSKKEVKAQISYSANLLGPRRGGARGRRPRLPLLQPRHPLRARHQPPSQGPQPRRRRSSSWAAGSSSGRRATPST